jgi:hypothetical protein
MVSMPVTCEDVVKLVEDAWRIAAPARTSKQRPQ